MRLSLILCALRRPASLRGKLRPALVVGGTLGGGVLVGALLGLVLAPACAAPTGASATPAEVVHRRLGLMGTWLTLEVEAFQRPVALRASEAAVQALEAAEQRLSTWREDSELAELNRAPVGAAFDLSPELAAELAGVHRWWQATDGGFDPAVGGLVRAWGLRTGGRHPSPSELAAAHLPRGLATLSLERKRATRRHPELILEEGGFGKGAGLDAALRALRETGATRAFLDLGGQVAVLGAQRRPFEWGIAHPLAREEIVMSVPLAHGSLATTGNSERGIVVDGVRLGHVLDPRSGRPAPDFGSLSVHAAEALAADCLSTGLYVLGPEAALAFGRAEAGVDVLVLEPRPDGSLRARATGSLGDGLRVLDARVELERLPDARPPTSGTPRSEARSLSLSIP